MSKGKLEAFKSAKFSLDASKVVGGVGPTYGNFYGTTNGQKDVYGTMDEARRTYNDPTRAQPNSGQDDLTYCN